MIYYTILYHKVITFSHFLPRQGLPFDASVPKVAKILTLELMINTSIDMNTNTTTPMLILIIIINIITSSEGCFSHRHDTTTNTHQCLCY